MRKHFAALVLFLGSGLTALAGQQPQDADPFPAKSSLGDAVSDPTQNRPEHFIWSQAPDSANTGKTYFRSRFTLASVPREATLYLAGPQAATVYLNGKQVGQFAQEQTQVSRPVVFKLALRGQLRVGTNVLAIDARAVQNLAYMPLEYMLVRGHYLLAKIVPAPEGIDAPPAMQSDAAWRAATSATGPWQQPGFDDSAWPQVRVLGTLEGDIDNYQWNADGGLYQWPGYHGIAPFLRHLTLPPVKVLDAVAQAAQFLNLDALTQPLAHPGGTRFSVTFPASTLPADPSQAPSLVLDFGRELSGRLRLETQAASAMRVSIQYGESLEEAVKKPYLGALPLLVQPSTPAFAQKTAFRFAKVTFLGGPPTATLNIDADAIFYPVNYTGSFESSDPLLNRIWAVGAYTAHLCMQDSIWDAPKRDRGRWMGDLDVSGRVIETAFDDRFLVEDTLRRLNNFPPGAQVDVNGIPGYSAMWVMGLKEYYMHTARKDFLLSMVPALESLLDRMNHDLDERHLFSNASGAWPFVDWSRDLAAPTAESRRATHLEYIRAFNDGAYLLREAGRPEAGTRNAAIAQEMRTAALSSLVSSAGTFGDRWQTNAMAIYSGTATEQQTVAIRQRIFSHIDAGDLPADDVSPYYGSYVLDALAQAGDKDGALVFMREWWGGMLAQGATSFWEGYDPRWPKEDFHANLRADGSQGYFVSLAHGWSAGPTAWLTEQILGIQPTAPGFARMTIRPDLSHLSFARGSESTPHGIVRVDAKVMGKGFDLVLDLPQGITASVSLPVSSAAAQVLSNGTVISSTATEAGTRRAIELKTAGTFNLHTD